MLLQHVVNAISLGGIYALLALGLAIVFSIVGLINFAHGELMTVAGYAMLGALLFGMPFPAAVLMAIATAALAAMAMERVAFRPMRGASVTSLLLTSFAVSALLKVMFQNGLSARPQALAMPQWMTGSYQMGSVAIGVGPTISIVISVLALVGLELFLRRTVTGTAMRAAAEDFRGRALDGHRSGSSHCHSLCIVRCIGRHSRLVVGRATRFGGSADGRSSCDQSLHCHRGRRARQLAWRCDWRAAAGCDRNWPGRGVAGVGRALS